MTEKEIYANRAKANLNKDGTPIRTDNTSCQVCDETMVFAMRDNYHEFSIGLSTILECLQAAEAEGFVPPLPAEWWFAVND